MLYIYFTPSEWARTSRYPRRTRTPLRARVSANPHFYYVNETRMNHFAPQHITANFIDRQRNTRSLVNQTHVRISLSLFRGGRTPRLFLRHTAITQKRAHIEPFNATEGTYAYLITTTSLNKVYKRSINLSTVTLLVPIPHSF